MITGRASKSSSWNSLGRGVGLGAALLVAALAASAPPPGDKSAPADPGLERARECVSLFQRDELTRLRERFSPEFAAAMSFEQLKEMRRRVREELGREIAVVEEELLPRDAYRMYRRRARFEKQAAPIDLLIALRADGSVGGFFLRPAPDAPPAPPR